MPRWQSWASYLREKGNNFYVDAFMMKRGLGDVIANAAERFRTKQAATKASLREHLEHFAECWGGLEKGLA